MRAISVEIYDQDCAELFLFKSWLSLALSCSFLPNYWERVGVMVVGRGLTFLLFFLEEGITRSLLEYHNSISFKQRSQVMEFEQFTISSY